MDFVQVDLVLPDQLEVMKWWWTTYDLDSYQDFKITKNKELKIYTYRGPGGLKKRDYTGEMFLFEEEGDEYPSYRAEFVAGKLLTLEVANAPSED